MHLPYLGCPCIAGFLHLGDRITLLFYAGFLVLDLRLPLAHVGLLALREPVNIGLLALVALDLTLELRSCAGGLVASLPGLVLCLLLVRDLPGNLPLCHVSIAKVHGQGGNGAAARVAGRIDAAVGYERIGDLRGAGEKGAHRPIGEGIGDGLVRCIGKAFDALTRFPGY